TLHPLKNENGHVEGLLFALLDVTQRKRAEEALHVNERSLRVALKSVDIALFHQDRNLRYTWMYSPQLGYTPEEVIGKMDSELLPPEDVPPIIELKRRVLETGVSARAEVSVTRLSKKHYFDLVVEPLVDATGRIVGVTGASTDITERKRTVQESKRKTALAQLLESLARAVNEAATPEEAMKICLSRLCDFGNWTLGRLASTAKWGGDPGIPHESVWYAADLARHAEFIRASRSVRALMDVGRFIHLVLHEKKPVWLPNITEAHGFARRAAALADGLRSAFAFPVVVQGEVVAFTEFYADTPRPIDLELVGASEIIAAQIAHLIERSRAMRRQEQLAVIVENSDDAIFSCGLDRTILTWNAAAERLFGYAAAEVIGCDALLLVPTEQRAEAALKMARLQEGKPVPTYEAVRLGKDGRRVEVSGTLSPIRDLSENLTGVSLTMRDIGGRKRAERERAQLAAIVESSNDAILIRGLDGAILSWNAAAERLFGWSAREAVGQPIDLIMPPERTGTQRRFIERTARSETLSPVETIHLRKDGARIPTQITFSPVRDQQGKVIAHSYTARDMTEFKRKEETLRGYASRLSKLAYRLRTVEEKERHAISRELHDRIGQELSALGLILGSLGAKLSQESLRAVEKQMHDMQALLKSIVENVRDVMAELRPPVLDDYGLLAALRQLASELAQRSGIAADLSGVDLQPRLPPIVETAMFRISQEALNNIAKHAQAKHVEISLHEVSGRVILDIADDGVGFDPNETPPDNQHWGLTTMRERAEAVGVVFRVESSAGAGTRIVLEAERAAI
ncbi:MAG TPA: PAS domain S-box protein, partial [Burkholderiales bacterium]|nr:PAS domain S-box protein [Burkholderiales bacterium]